MIRCWTDPGASPPPPSDRRIDEVVAVAVEKSDHHHHHEEEASSKEDHHDSGLEEAESSVHQLPPTPPAGQGDAQEFNPDITNKDPIIEVSRSKIRSVKNH